MEDRENGGFGGLGRGRAKEGQGAVVIDGDIEFDRHFDGDLFQSHGESSFAIVDLRFIIGELVDELAKGIEGITIVGLCGVREEVEVRVHGVD